MPPPVRRVRRLAVRGGGLLAVLAAAAACGPWRFAAPQAAHASVPADTSAA